ncbi:hypothetical protein [Lysinibacillus odysseyi]|uniref:hypothetical protein n=1 Tax=Lysinibacillus odysseyi TaxID=202611 RepID=UPI000A58C3F7|nr:hypothetical protein [Lysinibacillus odysseyi]
MIEILVIIIMFVLLFDGHTIRKQNAQLLEQNKEIINRLTYLQKNMEQVEE